MLTPDELAALPNSVVEHFTRLEADLLADIARRIRKAGTMTPSAEWQMLRLQELGAASDFVKNRLRQILNLSREEMDALYEEAAVHSARFDEELLSKLGKSTADTMNQPYIRQMLDAAREQAGAELENLTQTTAFRLKDGRTLGVQKAYEHALDYTQWQIVSGGIDPETAIRSAVKELADSGLRTVNYASGVQRTIEAAVRSCVVTGISQITGQISEANADALGTDIVEVDAHRAPRPSHASWQGKWFSLRGDTPEYPNLARVTGYGTPGGLKGPHCHHDFHAVIPGLSQPAYTQEELDKLNNPPPIVYEGKTYTVYKATQKQRQIERNIRQSKRRCMGYQAAGLEADYTAESVRLRRLNALYADFSAAADLPLQRERTMTAGWGRSESARSVSAARKAQKQKK